MTDAKKGKQDEKKEVSNAQTATLHLQGKEYQLPIVVGSENEVAIDVTSLRAQSGAITIDPGYVNTGSCFSEISYIDGDAGILRYRGYPIEELAESASYDEVIYLLIHGELPTPEQLKKMQDQINGYSCIDPRIDSIIESFPKSTHPMAALVATTSVLDGFADWGEDLDEDTYRILGQFKGIVARIARHYLGQPCIRSRAEGGYVEDFVHMMLGRDDELVVGAMNKLLILHADHEQNCSASTVRMVGSAQATLPASISAGIAALSGPLHGGANQRVIEMLEHIQRDGGDVSTAVLKAKDKASGFKLMGFGHRVYKNLDPRARIVKQIADAVFDQLGIDDKALDIARELEQAALNDDYFVQRKLYPNVDFYSGIIYRTLGIPTDMFTVMFAQGRLPGWIAQWREWVLDPKSRIHRPRQVYTGKTVRSFKKK